MKFSRRNILATIGGVTVSAASGPSSAAGYQSVDIIHLPVTILAQKIRTGEMTSVEVVTAFLDRIARVNGNLNAVVQTCTEESLRQAEVCDKELKRGKSRGVLHGVPFTIKDSFDTAGVISTGGTLGRKNHIPTRDSSIVQRLKAAGGILLGKTNTPELTLSYDTTNLVYGRTKNPYALDRTPGGSSGGAAAILAASGSPLDIGSDTAGSIRVPAHFCGVVGIKPTTGRVSRAGHIISYDGPIQALTHVGPMARCVADLRLVLPVVAGPDGVDPHLTPMTTLGVSVDVSNLKIGCFTDNGLCEPSRDVRNTMGDVARVVTARVASLRTHYPGVFTDAFQMYGKLISADGLGWIGRGLVRAGTKKSSLRMLRNPPKPVSTTHFVRRIEKWHAIKSHSLSVWNDLDAIICPISATAASPIGTTSPKAGFSYATPVNVLGWPAVAVRAGTNSAGLPIGVQVIAPPWREDVAMAVAELIEGQLGGWIPIRSPVLRTAPQ